MADAIVKGWGGNRDKPFWAMGVLASALAAADGSRQNDGLDLVWRAASDIRDTIAAADAEALAPLGLTCVRDADALVFTTPDGALRLSPHRIRVLKKLAEFLMAADGFAYAQDVMTVFSGLAGLGAGTLDGPGGFPAVKDAARALARIAYRYRTDHFLDGHAGSAFSIVKSYLAARDFTVDDDTVLEFWCAPDNEKYRTYEASFGAFQSFAEAIEVARAVQGAESGIAADDPVVQGALVSGLTGTDELDAEAALALEAQLGDVPDALANDDDDAADAPPNSTGADNAASDPTAPDRLGAADLRLLGQRDVALLSRLAEIGRFGLDHPLASLRLIAFHTVQSGISNGLRTGRWKIPLERRVTCEEARAYEAVVGDVTEVGDRLRGWLEVAFALEAEEEARQGEAEEARQSGLTVLSRSRSKSLQKDPAELRRAFKAVSPALIRARSLAGDFVQRVERRYPSSRADDLGRQFTDDVGTFSNEFRRRYLTTQGASAPEGPDATRDGEGD